jgi:hypothetical protein
MQGFGVSRSADNVSFVARSGNRIIQTNLAGLQAASQKQKDRQRPENMDAAAQNLTEL